jgi:hypothetical protein
MLLSTLKTPSEEEEVAGVGVAVPKRVEWVPTEVEGTSIEMTGAVENCILRSVISWSFMKSIFLIFLIIIMICGAYPQLRRAVLEMLMISYRIKSNTEKGLFSM